MSNVRIVGVGVGLVLSFFAFLFLLFSMGIYLHEPGVPARGANIAFASLPLLITVGIVFLCFSAGDASFGRALLYTIVAEVLGLLLGSLLLAAFVFLGRSPRVILQRQTPIIATTNLLDVPHLPLSIEAVGVESPDGKFNPIMFLTGPVPRRGYKTPLLTVDLKAGAPKFKIYRGTNELAAANQFLGEFQIAGYSRTKQSLQLMVIFDLDTKQELSVQARDVDATHNTALKIKRIDTTK
jgi:hypothetical protein